LPGSGTARINSGSFSVGFQFYDPKNLIFLAYDIALAPTPVQFPGLPAGCNIT
jgi:hypothetical protein